MKQAILPINVGKNKFDQITGKTIRQLEEEKLFISLISPIVAKDDREGVTKDLFAKFSNLREIIYAPKRSIKSATYYGDVVYFELQRLRELAINLARLEIDDQPVLDQYEQIIHYCRTFLAGETQEQFHALFLNKAMQLVGEACIRTGTIDHVTVYPRELIELAMDYQAGGIILVHNHPSGNIKPSRADIAMTGTLVKISKILGMTIIDHLIIGRHSTFSFKKHNLITNLSI